MARPDRSFPSFFGGEQPMAPETYYIRLRGLPFSAREEDVRNFLKGIPTNNVTFTLTATGRASGECYVELNDTSAVKDALLLHKKEMGGRYIEVFSVSEQERLQMVRNGVLHGPGEAGIQRPAKYVVRLRGLPFETNNDDIKEFFEGLDIEDIVIDLLAGGRPSGEAFVRFATKEHAEKALERNKSYMGSRYVEVFRSSWDEMENSYYESHGYPEESRGPPGAGPIPLREAAAAFGVREMPRPRPLLDFDDFYDAPDLYPRRGAPMGLGPIGRERGGFRSSPYGEGPFPSRRSRLLSEEDDFGPPMRRGGRMRGDDKLFMRGMPYSVTGVEIEMFFEPLLCTEIKLGYGPDGRPSGDALVTFDSVLDCDRALSRSGRMMGSRYVELFPASEMPASAKRVEFRSVSSSTSLLKLPGLSAKSNAAGYGREKNRGPPSNRGARSSPSGRNPQPSRNAPPAPGIKRSSMKEPLPTPVPKPTPLAQLGSAPRKNVGSYSEGTGAGSGYGYGSFSSAQQHSSQSSSFGSQSYSSNQTPSSFPSQTYGQASSYGGPSAYGSQSGFSNTSYSQQGYGASSGYDSQTTYGSQTTYPSQPYYSQSSAYGQGYSQPSYGQVPYGSGEASKPAW